MSVIHAATTPYMNQSPKSSSEGNIWILLITSICSTSNYNLLYNRVIGDAYGNLQAFV